MTSLLSTLLFSTPKIPPPHAGRVFLISPEREERSTAGMSIYSKNQTARMAPVREANRGKVLEAIRAGKSKTADIADETDLSDSAIRKIAGELIEDGLVMVEIGQKGRFFYYPADGGRL